MLFVCVRIATRLVLVFRRQPHTSSFLSASLHFVALIITLNIIRPVNPPEPDATVVVKFSYRKQH